MSDKNIENMETHFYVFVRLKKAMKDRQRKENKKKIAWAHNFLRVTYPIFCLSFVIGFWLLGLYHYWAHGDGADEVTTEALQTSLID